MTEIDDIVTENEDLQEALLKKDKVIEELERQISCVVRNSEIQMKKNLDKMKIEYELMARSAVSGKMRKMNEYLNMKLKEQESLDADKENMSKGIQIDLEERLSNTSNELTQIKKRLKSREIKSYKIESLCCIFRIRIRAVGCQKSVGYKGENVKIRRVS